MYSKNPQGKIKKIHKWLMQGRTKELDIDQAIEAIESKFGVFVFCYYGRLLGQVHTLEIWSRTNQYRDKEREMKELLCTFEVPIENFRLTIG